MNKELLNSKRPLNEKDNINKTFGCRHTNPDICSNNSIFVHLQVKIVYANAHLEVGKEYLKN